VDRPGNKGWYGRVLGLLHGVGSSWAIVMAAWIVLDVLGRALFNHPLQGTAEVVAYSLPFATFLQIPYVLRARAHLRSPLIEDLLGEPGRAGFAALGCALGIALFGLGVYSIWTPMITAWQAGESVGDGVVEIPSGPLWTAILTGCVLMVTQFSIELVGSLRIIFNGAVAQKP
jgi:TRAP-type C4-dicarboxylate transport system permease small subunit